jgi:hypothetical protein
MRRCSIRGRATGNCSALDRLLPQYEKFALMRYAAVRARAGDWKSFQCGYGVMMNDQMSQLVRGNTLCSDGAEHDALRGVIVRP